MILLQGLPLFNGAVRSPDVAWISGDRWNRLTEEQQRHKFSPITPAFVVELRSNSDDLETLHAKMQEYYREWGEAWVAD